MALSLGLAPVLVVATGGCPTAPLNDCEDASKRVLAKLASCNIELPSEPCASCTEAEGEAAQCFAKCVEAASCEAFDGTGADIFYIDCVNACSPSTCAIDPTETGTSGSGSSAGTTMTSISTMGDNPTADDSGTSDSGGSDTTGGPASNVPVGTHPGAPFPLDLHVLQAATEWAAVVASSSNPKFINLSTDTDIEALSVGEAAGGGIAGGAASAFAGFPGLYVATAAGDTWSPMAEITDFPAAFAIAMVAAPSGGPSERVCGASNDPVISCVDAVGNDWVMDLASTTDAMWAANCVTFTTGGLAVVDDWALLSSGSSKLCHGALGPGAQATEIPGVGGLDIECPGNSIGEAKVCAVLAYDATMSTLYWDTPSAAPVLVDTVPICDGATKMEGRVSDDDSQVMFAMACNSADESHLVTASADDGTVVGHAVYALPGCNGQVAALPTTDRVTIGCNGTVEVVDTADFTPM